METGAVALFCSLAVLSVLRSCDPLTGAAASTRLLLSGGIALALGVLTRDDVIIVAALALAIIIAAGIYAYVILSNGRVAVDNASVKAPLITLGPSAPGLLQAVYVKEGDTIAANVPVATLSRMCR